MRNWFLPDVPDLLGLLNHQAAVTAAGIDDFLAWSHGDASREAAVDDAEHAADESRRAVLGALRSAFATPLDPEDLYELSERLDTVMNAAKNIVREAEVIAMAPDRPMGLMAEHLSDGLAHLVRALQAISRDDDLATTESDGAVGTVRALERTYRGAMSDLLAESDLRELMGRRELYRRYSRAGEAVESVAERIWYAVVKSA